MSDVIKEYQSKRGEFLVHAEEWDDGFVTWDISKLHPIEEGKRFKPETCRRFQHTIGFSGQSYGVEDLKYGEADDIETARKDMKKVLAALGETT